MAVELDAVIATLTSAGAERHEWETRSADPWEVEIPELAAIHLATVGDILNFQFNGAAQDMPASLRILSNQSTTFLTSTGGILRLNSDSTRRNNVTLTVGRMG